MTEDQKKVILDYATELQTNDAPWELFEGRGEHEWIKCTNMFNPIICAAGTFWKFRRKPRTITVTMPVPISIMKCSLTPAGDKGVQIWFDNESDRDTALAEIGEAMKEQGE